MRWSEETVVELIKESLGDCIAEGARGLLDDGAHLPKATPKTTRVISCDAFQEGNDFLTTLSSVESAGYRAIIQNLSDLAAMGASPVGFVWSLEVPERWLKKRGALLRDFCAGASQACQEYSLKFYGGDLSFSNNRFGCTVTILGDVKGAPLSRQGARPGDVIYVSKALGLSAFGLDILFGKEKGGKDAIAGHLHPKAEIALAKKLVGKVSACMDISDGFARDLHRLCQASKVGAELDNVGALAHPLIPEEKAKKYALHGGEDFALLFTAKPTLKIPQACVRVGTITQSSGIFVIEGSKRKSLAPQGYDHFTSRT